MESEKRKKRSKRNKKIAFKRTGNGVKRKIRKIVVIVTENERLYADFCALLLFFAAVLLLWLMAEWKARLPFRILAVFFLLNVFFCLIDFFFISPIRHKFADTRFNYYESARRINLLLQDGEITKITNALAAFIETENEWDAYPFATYQLMNKLSGSLPVMED